MRRKRKSDATDSVLDVTKPKDDADVSQQSLMGNGRQELHFLQTHPYLPLSPSPFSTSFSILYLSSTCFLLFAFARSNTCPSFSLFLSSLFRSLIIKKTVEGSSVIPIKRVMNKNTNTVREVECCVPSVCLSAYVCMLCASASHRRTANRRVLICSNSSKLKLLIK